MSKCLNCGKECKSKFCSIYCQNEYRHKQYVEKYYKSPKYCKNCGEIISYEKRTCMFCNSTCSASYNNKLRLKRSTESLEKTRKTLNDNYRSKIEKSKWYKILNDSDEETLRNMLKNSSSKIDFQRKIGFIDRVTRRQNEIIIEMLETKGLSYNDISHARLQSNTKGVSAFDNMTKKQLFDRYGHWILARVRIVKHAWRAFKNANKRNECVICDYNKHIEIAHIKSVSDFTDDTLIKDIDNPNNLIALCPNYHWEYDNDSLSDIDRQKLDDIIKSGNF